MKSLVLGILLVAVGVWAVAAPGPLPTDGNFGANPREAASLARAGAAGDLIAFSENIAQKYQQVTVIDAKQKVISVYHVDLGTGQIALRSVRAIQWDLRMSDYNGKTPLPREIQAMSEQR
ncbi:MAG: hypothetical protein JW818_19340 [Pirellulales bacterium]|nr:hypothetical protein [Pirellulales bacterium]